MNVDEFINKHRKARLRSELDELETEAKAIAMRRDQVAKELDTLTIEMNVQQMTEDYPAFERELLKMSFVEA
jgi:archaellum component FlaC